VADVAVEIVVAGVETEWVFAQEAADDRIVVASAVVVETGAGIVLATCELEAVAGRRIRLRQHRTKGHVVDVINELTGGVDNVANGAKGIGQIPAGPRPWLPASENLIGAFAEEIASLHRAVCIVIGPGVVAVVDREPRGAIDGHGDAAIEDIVGVLLA